MAAPADDAGRMSRQLAERQGAVERDPASASAWTNLAQTLISLERMEEARAAIDTALRLDASLGAAHLAKARLHFLEGDLVAGWPEFEWRFETGAAARRPVNAPLWRGEPLEGKLVLVHGEQGMGDTLQFVRFLPRLAEAGARVLLGCQPPLHRLLQGVAGARAVISHGARLPRLDFHCPLLSVPGRLRLGLADVTVPVPYVTAPASGTRTRPRVAGDRFRVGLVWAGNPLHPNDRNRSLPLAALRPLSGVPGTRIHSLQFGPARRELGVGRRTAWLEDAGASLEDMGDTARVMQRLDLMITVDTAAAHLAGALGVETWLLLPPAPDWRWLLGRADSPWYPTMRLFRRAWRQDVPAFVTEVTKALEARAGGAVSR